MLGALFLSLTVTLSLGPNTTSRTAARRGSLSLTWDPPEGRQFLWDVEERWLYCIVHDGANDLGIEGSIAGEGCIDLLGVDVGGEDVTVELFAPSDEDTGIDLVLTVEIHGIHGRRV
eukprot:UN3004